MNQFAVTIHLDCDDEDYVRNCLMFQLFLTNSGVKVLEVTPEDARITWIVATTSNKNELLLYVYHSLLDNDMKNWFEVQESK